MYRLVVSVVCSILLVSSAVLTAVSPGPTMHTFSWWSLVFACASLIFYGIPIISRAYRNLFYLPLLHASLSFLICCRLGSLVGSWLLEPRFMSDIGDYMIHELPMTIISVLYVVEHVNNGPDFPVFSLIVSIFVQCVFGMAYVLSQDPAAVYGPFVTKGVFAIYLYSMILVVTAICLGISKLVVLRSVSLRCRCCTPERIKFTIGPNCGITEHLIEGKLLQPIDQACAGLDRTHSVLRGIGKSLRDDIGRL